MIKPLVLLVTLLAPLLPCLGFAESDGQSATPPQPSLRGIPFYKIFEENEIAENSSGYFITSSPDGRLLYANETGLHTYDGVKWNQIYRSQASPEKIRSLIWTEDEVFAGAYGAIGKLRFDDPEEIRFEPINTEPLSSYVSEFYSAAYRIENELYFVGERSVAVYNLEDDTLYAHVLDNWLKGSIVCSGELLVADEARGLLAIKGKDMRILPEFATFVEGATIMHMAKDDQGRIVFSTRLNELYQVAPGAKISEYQPFNYQTDAEINDIAFVSKSRIAMSLGGYGIVILNTEGRVLQAIDRSLDYRWAGANRLYADGQNALWTIFNTTIGEALVNDPLTQLDERLRPSVFYPYFHQWNGKIYIRSNGRLFTPVFDQEGRLVKFEEPLKAMQKIIALALPGPDGLYLHAEEHTYLYDGENVTHLGYNGLIDRLVQCSADPTRYLGVSGTEVKLLERSGDRMTTVATIPHGAGVINQLVEDRQGNFWLEIGLGRVGKVTVLGDKLTFKLYTASHGLPPDWVVVWMHEGEPLFSEHSGVFRFDSKTDTFSRTLEFEPYFPAGEGSFHRAVTDPKGNVWASYENHNYILWKQEDGSYIKDSYSLSQLSDIYMSKFTFLENGDAILSTSTEIFHLDASLLSAPDRELDVHPELIEVSNLEGTLSFYRNPGHSPTPEPFSIPKEQRGLSFHIGVPDSGKTKSPEFQYSLAGSSNGWSKWSDTSVISFTKLEPGLHTLLVRSRLGRNTPIAEIAIPFEIVPTFWETPLAYLLYALAGAGALLLVYNRFTQNLKQTNEKLEQMVTQRTTEISNKNSELQTYADELAKTLEELRSAQDLLMSTSRKAGMAEVATNVLHNVGNVLNSVNVGVLSLSERLEQERVVKLSRISELINENRERLNEFLTQDPKGRAIPTYLSELSKVLHDDFSHYRIELDCIQENIEHIKKIIATQQTHAKTVEVLQAVNVPELIDAAIELALNDREHSIYEITKEYESGLEIVSDKHSILQMLTNFIKNAKESIHEQRASLGLINVSASKDANPDYVRIQITDNGVGIDLENQRKVFTHGFTTKKEGHGFGMHSSANAAKTLGGDLKIESEGLGKGATVTLILPISPVQKDPQEDEPALAQPET